MSPAQPHNLKDSTKSFNWWRLNARRMSWQRVGYWSILLLSVALNFYRLDQYGYSNEYYAAAVKWLKITLFVISCLMVLQMGGRGGFGSQQPINWVQPNCKVVDPGLWSSGGNSTASNSTNNTNSSRRGFSGSVQTQLYNCAS